MKKINVVQYIPYFPPHKGGLETHAAERAKRRVKSGYGDCLVATYDVGQVSDAFSSEQDGYTIVRIPAFDLIAGFPFPKFWTQKYWKAHSSIKKFKPTILITRTRFFISSFLGGCFALMHKIQWVHIEHGVDYVKMNAKRKEYIARLYDQLFGLLVFRCSDHVIAISAGCKRFAQKFTKKDIPVIYRGLDFVPSPRVEKDGQQITLGFVGRLTRLKGVDIILQAYKQLVKEGVDNTTLEIVGDGEERENLEQLTKKLGLEDSVAFLGYKDKDYLEKDFYPRVDICLNASWQEGLPTSVIEPLLSGCVVVATVVGGTPEITKQEDLLLCEPGDIDIYTHTMRSAINSYKKVSGLSYSEVKERFDWSNNIEKYRKQILLYIIK